MTLEGLALERTSLAWSRTALAFSGVAALLVRGYMISGRVDELLAAVAAMISAVVVGVTARRRRRRVDAVAYNAFVNSLEQDAEPGTDLLPAANLSVRIIGVMGAVTGVAVVLAVVRF